jgi:hypothetical protein
MEHVEDYRQAFKGNTTLTLTASAFYLFILCIVARLLNIIPEQYSAADSTVKLPQDHI